MGYSLRNLIEQQLPIFETEKSEVYSEVKEVELCRIWKRKQI